MRWVSFLIILGLVSIHEGYARTATPGEISVGIIEMSPTPEGLEVDLLENSSDAALPADLFGAQQKRVTHKRNLAIDRPSQEPSTQSHMDCFAQDSQDMHVFQHHALMNSQPPVTGSRVTHVGAAHYVYNKDRVRAHRGAVHYADLKEKVGAHRVAQGKK